MHQALSALRTQLSAAADALQQFVPGSRGLNLEQNWQFPGISGQELVEDVRGVLELVDDCDVEDLGPFEERVNDYIHRLEVLRTQTIPNMLGSHTAIPSLTMTMEGVRQVVNAISGTDAAKSDEARKQLHALRTRLRALDTLLVELESRGGPLKEMVTRIEEAHAAADQLPLDMHTLSEAKNQVRGALDQVESDQTHVANILENVQGEMTEIQKNGETAAKVLVEVEKAYAAATSVGLARAFAQRSRQLKISILYWTCGLAAALLLAVYLGSTGAQPLLSLFGLATTKPANALVQALLSALSVSAPVWFAWLATKQIGQRFRISEDYGYKAAVASAYEAFRQEAARVSQDTEASLIKSALEHLNDHPLRLVEKQSPGSPLHELSSKFLTKRKVAADDNGDDAS